MKTILTGCAALLLALTLSGCFYPGYYGHDHYGYGGGYHDHGDHDDHHDYGGGYGHPGY